MTKLEERKIVVGRISGLYGVRGWVRVYSYTAPREEIICYSPWQIGSRGQWREMRVAEGRKHGKGIVARLVGCDDRDLAAALMGSDIVIPRSRLPETVVGEYYWTDLVGLKVVTSDGVELGVIKTLMETGANDVLVVQGEQELLIPYIYDDVVVKIDLEQQLMQVDWEPEY